MQMALCSHRTFATKQLICTICGNRVDHLSQIQPLASGWFEMQTFEDWFMTLALPYLKKLEGKKIMIGDNFSSHLSTEVIKQCEENDIAFVLLPPDSTHILQPLDVLFFRPLKRAWKNLLEEEKNKRKGCFTLSKDSFPSLISKLHTNVDNNAASNLKSGFEKCGIFPLTHFIP